VVAEAGEQVGQSAQGVDLLVRSRRKRILDEAD
jgi:hypothetical protein